MARGPAARVDVVKAALPPVRATVANVLAPSLNVAEPVGVPVVEDLTVAVKVTVSDNAAGFIDEVSVVVVLAA